MPSWPASVLAPPLPTPPATQQYPPHPAHAHFRQHFQRLPSFPEASPFGASSAQFFSSPPPHPFHPSPAPLPTQQQPRQQLDEQPSPWTRTSAAQWEGADRQWPRPNTVQTQTVLPSLSSVVGPGNWDFPTLSSPSRPAINSDGYLEAILNGDFSSPSIPPQSPFPYQLGAEAGSFLQSPRQQHQQQQQRVTSATGIERRAAGQDPSEATSPFKREASESGALDLTSSPRDVMPPLRKRPGSPTAARSGGPAAKRQRGSADASARPRISPKRPKREEHISFERDFFLSEDEKDDLVETVDLVDAKDNEDVIDPKPKVDKSIKLSAFQCVICMDDVQDLTVTYCGHLFCSECLHSSLHIDVSKKICPICRQKIELRKTNAKGGSKTYFPLELKLMTRNRIGKRPAR